MNSNVAALTSKNSFVVFENMSFDELSKQSVIHIKDVPVSDRLVDVRFTSKNTILAAGRNGELILYNFEGEVLAKHNVEITSIHETRAVEVSRDGHWIVYVVYNYKERKPELIICELNLNLEFKTTDTYLVPSEFEEVILANFNDVVIFFVKGVPVIACNQVSYGSRIMFFAINELGAVKMLENGEFKCSYQNSFQMFNWTAEDDTNWIMIGGETSNAAIMKVTISN